MVLNILQENIHDRRFIGLIANLLKAGYLEEWVYHKTFSGVPQGGVLSPILSNLVLDRLDKFLEQQLIPANTRGRRRKTYPPYVALTKAAWKARRAGDRAIARIMAQQAQRIPSRDPNDPNFRRLRYVRYADDALIGFVGPRAELKEIKHQLTDFLHHELKLELNQEKTLITHARTDKARFLGYEIHTLHADDQHDHRGQRCINGGIGLRVPKQVITNACRKYMQGNKPIHLTQRVNDDAFSIVAQYQTEYRGLVSITSLPTTSTASANSNG
jgi:hypothetical protein